MGDDGRDETPRFRGAQRRHEHEVRVPLGPEVVDDEAEDRNTEQDVGGYRHAADCGEPACPAGLGAVNADAAQLGRYGALGADRAVTALAVADGLHARVSGARLLAWDGRVLTEAGQI